MRIGYVRVSSSDQNESRQIESLKNYDIEKWYMEKISGKDMNRPQLQQMLEFAREGDTIYIHDFSRLARSTVDLLGILDKLNEKKINLVSHKENLDTSTPTGKLMVTVIGAINEFERACILDRQMEGIVIAKRAGKYKGRPPKKIDKELYSKLMMQYTNRQISKKQFAEKLGVTMPTLNRIIEKTEE